MYTRTFHYKSIQKALVASRSYGTLSTSKRVSGFGPSVFAEFSPLAVKHQAVNLGQGFPNFAAPEFIKQAAANAIHADINQYTRSQGHLRLVNAIANNYSSHLSRTINPLTEIVVTSGATEALFASLQAVIDEGDEVILIEPFYDAYPADVVMAGGIPKYVPLRIEGDSRNPSNWKIDFKELENAITKKTKVLIINNPQNIPGRVFSLEELQAISAIAIKHNLIVISDEVYEYLVYDGKKHIQIAALPGMWDRTITISSAGKTFSTTGWKIGWAIAPPKFCDAIQMAHQWIVFSVSSPMQEAAAIALEKSKELNYFHELQQLYHQKKTKLSNILEKHGLSPIIPQGSYFMLADVSKINKKAYFNPSDSSPKDYQFCRWLTKEIGVAAIPMTPFYSPENARIASKFIRFTFCKTDDLLEEADKRLAKLEKYVV